MTNRSISPLLFAAALAWTALGCGRDCEALCEDTKECKGADKNEECAKSCEDAAQLNEDAGCEDLYDEYLSCTNNSADVCRVGDACESESIQWTDCLTKFCTNPDNEGKCD